jgi:hypothetical protein
VAFVRGLLWYLVLPNLAFFLAGQAVFLDRALVNCDYLFLWVASCYLRRGATLLLYLGIVALDLVLSAESIYHFTTLETLLAADVFLKFHPAVLAAAAGALLLALLWLARIREPASARPSLRPAGRLAVGAVALALSAQSLLRSADPFEGYLETFGRRAVAASGVLEAGLAGYRVATTPEGGVGAMPAAEATTSRVVRDLSRRGVTSAPDGLLVVVVESQGLLRNAGDMRRLFAPLMDPAVRARYKVNQGTVRFFGSTVYGELRALCRVYVPQATPVNMPGQERCLPNVLLRLGYETVSFHGFEHWFYERSTWYPQVGFRQRFFANDLRALGAPDCGSLFFRGVCDLWIADRIEHQLASAGRKEFVYWMTLNSHLPVDHELAEGSSFDCSKTESLRDEKDPCGLEKIHYQLYQRIARMALNPNLPRTRFTLVGDHMPPFPTLEERALYDQRVVPYVELVPKEAS